MDLPLPRLGTQHTRSSITCLAYRIYIPCVSIFSTLNSILSRSSLRSRSGRGLNAGAEELACPMCGGDRLNAKMRRLALQRAPVLARGDGAFCCLGNARLRRFMRAGCEVLE